MKKVVYGALFGLLFMAVTFLAIARANGAPVLSYVYSNSMEPLIKVNDAFFVWPDKSLQVGDIIVFRPLVLEAPYITHRIIAIGDNGFATKGDNSPYIDQESGEPLVTADRIAGKVVTLNGQPFLVPGLGALSSIVQGAIGSNARSLSGVLLILAIFSLFTGRRVTRMRKPRHRFRLRHAYRFISILGSILVIISIYLGSGVTQVKYLVSEYPGSRGDQIAVNQPGRLTMEVKNNGFIPVWSILQGIPPISSSEDPKYLPPRSNAPVILSVLPQRETGLFQGYIQVYNYPILMPRSWNVFLHSIHPVFAIVSVGMIFGIWISLFFKVLNYVHGFEDWIPLSAIRNKISERRRKRYKGKMMGRRRVR